MCSMEKSTARPIAPRDGVASHPAVPPTDKVSDLLAQSTERRRQQAAEPQRFTGSWFDPDPEAIGALSPIRHPVTGYIQRTRGDCGKRHGQIYAMRTVLAVLTGSNRAGVTWDQVLAYPWHHVGPDEAQVAYRTLTIMYPNVNSSHHFVQMLRSILKGCRDAKLISHVRYMEIVEQLPRTSKGEAAANRRRLTASELAKLMRAAREDQMPMRGARDSAIIAVFATTGIRVSELVALDLADWNQHEQTLYLAMTKSGRSHVVPVDPRTAEYLSAWLEHRGTAHGPLFVSTSRPATMTDRLLRMRTETVRHRIRSLAGCADIGSVGTHDFRRTVASTLLRTTDAALVSRLLGHSSLAATLVYDMASEDEQRAAIATLPLQGKTPDSPDVAGGPAS